MTVKSNRSVSPMRVLACSVALAALIGIGYKQAFAATWSTSGNQIRRDGVASNYVMYGANALHNYGAGSSDMNSWGLDIVREAITNVRDTPLSGVPYQSGTTYWHSLQSIVDANRAQGKVTILCPFAWDGTDANKFTGRNPASTSWWAAYKTKMQAWANQFKTQSDVWIEVWNEPYAWDRSNSYTDDLWLTDMRTMVSNIRATGNNNIIVVPGSEQGQEHDVFISKGVTLSSEYSNIVYDVHAYEAWMTGGITQSTIETRLQNVKNANVPLIMGEVGPMNASSLMNPTDVLQACSKKGVPTLAWIWKKDAADQDALLTSTGAPNNNNNNNWGTMFQNFGRLPRNLKSGHNASALTLAADYDTGTYWTTNAAQSNGMYISADLGIARSISQVKMNHGSSPGDYPRNWVFYTSTDGTNWTQRASGTGSSSGTTTITLGIPVTADYIKIVQTGSSTSWWTIYELTVN